MNKKVIIKAAAIVVSVLCVVFLCANFSVEVLQLSSYLAVKSAQIYLPSGFDLSLESEQAQAAEKEIETEAEQSETTEPAESKTEKATESKTTEAQTETASAVSQNDDFYGVPNDIQALIYNAEKNSKSDEKDGDITEKTYTDDGVTDKYGVVKVKNTNETQIDVKALLSEKADLSVSKDEPTVLIYHTHTTETYQILDRSFYAVGFLARSNDIEQNMVRVGDEICAELEKAGYKVIHDRTIHDTSYNGAYDDSKKSVEEYLKKYPSIQITLDIHRDAIQTSSGTKIKPVAEIGGKKAAQVMIISGCQEDGNSIEGFSDWRYNLIFALQLQKTMEESFSGLTRPLYFCPRKYNMNLTRCSLLIEVGSDANTLDEACFAGRCIGSSLAKLMANYE